MADLNYAFLARTAVHAAELIPQWENVLAHFEMPEREQRQWREWIDGQRWAISEVERLMPNPDLLRAYQRTTGEPGDREADALLAEIERRGLKH